MATSDAASACTSLADPLLRHYVELAKLPGWKAYAWARINEMAKAEPQMWGAWPALLVEAVKRG